MAEYPLFSELDPAEVGSFERDLTGSTCPLVEVDGRQVQGFYPWDYARWRERRICDAFPAEPPVLGEGGPRVAWLSDLHLREHNLEGSLSDIRALLERAKADAVLLTGDICEGPARLEETIRRLGTVVGQVWFVLGNHDFYGAGLAEVDAWRRTYAGPGVLLDYAVPIHLGDGVYLAGNGGWGGGFQPRRCAGIRDWQAIMEYKRLLSVGEVLREVSPSAKQATLEALLKLAAARASKLVVEAEGQLALLPADARHLIFATHVPVVRQASRYQRRASDPELLAHFCWPEMGRRLAAFAETRPGLGLTVLSGHTHTRAFAETGGIQHAVAGAEYGEPRIAAVFTPGFFLDPAAKRAAALKAAFTYRAIRPHPCLRNYYQRIAERKRAVGGAD